MTTTSVPPGLGSERGLLFRVALATVLAVTLVAAAAALTGMQIASLAARSGIERRASLLAVTTSSRLQEVPGTEWAEFLERLASRVGGTVTVVGSSGAAIADAPESLLPRGHGLLGPDHAHGVVVHNAQPYFVATEAIEFDGARHHLLVALPLTAGAAAITRLLFTLLGVLLAAGVLGVASALTVARDIATDVRAIAHRSLSMSSGESAALQPLPVRARDEVGELVAAFNRLQARFAVELEAHRLALSRLEDAERRREALIATLRHELRTPLNSIIGFAELVLSGADGELTPVQREDVEVVARSGRHLLQLVVDVLDLSAIASGRYTVEMRAVDIAAITREVVREAQGSARRRNVSVHLDAPLGVIVDGDPISLRRAVTNLVQNAIDHAGGEVHVGVDVDGRNARVSVRDNGPGIRAQDLKRLFKPFERGRTGESNRPGAGLGLAITVALLDMHAGSLRAESEVGKGSLFVATVPLRLTALDQAGYG